jgi:hypothetical protein
MRERCGHTMTHVGALEAEGVAVTRANVAAGATVHADEASHWDKLAAHFPIKRINHQQPIPWTAPGPIRLGAFSAVFASLTSAFITTSQARTSPPELVKWLGARMPAESPTGISLQ